MSWRLLIDEDPADIRVTNSIWAEDVLIDQPFLESTTVPVVKQILTTRQALATVAFVGAIAIGRSLPVRRCLLLVVILSSRSVQPETREINCTTN